jgi:putative flavoprotein involved in K+ transport
MRNDVADVGYSTDASLGRRLLRSLLSTRDTARVVTRQETPMLRTDTDVVVIGAGQAGLAMGYFLKKQGSDFVIVDAAAEVGHVWRSRWDSLRLFTPGEFDALPGLPFPARAGTHPTKDDVADYLQEYARTFALPVRLDTRVTRVHRLDDRFVVETSTGIFHTQQVVVATGPFQRPHVPNIAAVVPSDVVQLHSAYYRNPAQLPRGGRTLVVGAANSGLQIAAELSRTRTVTVAAGATPPQLPQRFLGRDTFTWLTHLGVMTRSADSRLSRRLRARGDVVIGSSTKHLRSKGVEFRARLHGFDGSRAVFADGTSALVDAVVWATGYRNDYSWLDVAGAVQDDNIRHDKGRTVVPGLHVIGLPWQTSRGSALLGFVGRDAAEVAERVAHASQRREALAQRAALAVAH